MAVYFYKLFDKLAELNITQKELMQQIGASSSTFAKMRNNQPVTFDVIVRICEAAKRCMNNKSEVIDQKDIKHGFEKLQEIFGDGLRGDKIEKIKNVYANPYSLIQDEEELKLMRSEIIIEYNCKQWRGIHPAVEEHLIQLGVLDRKTKFKKS